MTCRRKTLLAAVLLLILGLGIGGVVWYRHRQATAVDRQVNALVDSLREEKRLSAAGYVTTRPKASGIERLLIQFGLRPDQQEPRGMYRTADALAELGRPAVPGLIRASRDGDSDVRYAATAALGKLADSRATEPLIALLKDESPLVRQTAAESLGKQGDDRAIESLLAALKDKDGVVAVVAAQALSVLGESRGIEFLSGALKDPYWGVRFTSAYALGEVGDANAVRLLEGLLNDEYPEVRQAAKEAIAEIRARAASKPATETQAVAE